jgi:peptidoglycan hydrolase-like protein with peptidoglycan-binding domain
VLKYGARNADVIRVQRALNAAASPYLSVNGVYNAATRSAVTTYQRKLGISATGVVASQTWAALVRGRR